jgi:hypothetical protein
MKHWCVQYDGNAMFVSDAKSGCTSVIFKGGGEYETWVESPCSHSDALGGCRYVDMSGDSSTHWFYVTGGEYADASMVMSFCQQDGATFVTP